MKKILPYIFLFLIIANLFAPLSLHISQEKAVALKTNTVEAADCEFVSATFKPAGAMTKPLTIPIEIETKNCTGKNYSISGSLLEIDDYVDNPVFGIAPRPLTKDVMSINLSPGEKYCGNSDCHIRFVLNIKSASNIIKTYTSNDTTETITYSCDVKGKCDDAKEWGEDTGTGNVVTQEQATVIGTKQKLLLAAEEARKKECQDASDHKNDEELKKKCEDATQKVKDLEKELADAQNGKSDSPAVDNLPACGFGIFDNSTIMGCVIKVTYYAIFVPTSYLFALTGMFFDWTFHYSVQDTSYRSDFVVKGWGLVRDFCNMFFIFVLLYIAFSTILNVHGFKTKEMVINVVIIGLMINFSLFASQVIVDASNILARVFYNSDAINIDILKNGNDGLDSGGIGLYDTTDNDEIPLSAAIVGKINPALIITEATQPGKISPNTDLSNLKNADEKKQSLGVGTWFLVTLLSIAINIVGIIVFLSVALIFIARVVGIWIYMVLAPFAFFSYTVPSMQNIDMVGWKKWWPELIKMSFLAPVFMFFLYLILKFVESGLGILGNDKKEGMAFVIGVIVPFAFIMILMMKAKDIAKKMSGQLGQTVTGAVAMAGGVALGAATGGAALMGRASIGRIANKVDKSDWLNDTAAGKKGWLAQKTIGVWGKKAASYTAKGSFDFRQTGAGNTFSQQTGLNLNKGVGAVGLDTKAGLGGYAGVQQRKVEKHNKFGESLGASHHLTEELEDKISERKDLLDKAEAEQARTKAEADRAKGTGKANEKAANDAYATAQQKVNNLKSGDSNGEGDAKKGLAALEKDLERAKVGRQKEYALTVKRRSGRIYDIDKAKTPEEIAKYRDDYGNIKKFGRSTFSWDQAGKQIGSELLEGVLKGAAAGTIAGPLGMIGGGLAGGVRELMRYSGTTNRKVGEAHHDKHEKAEDKYKPPSPSAPHADSGGHDDHGGGDDHGGDHGGGHH